MYMKKSDRNGIGFVGNPDRLVPNPVRITRSDQKKHFNC